MRRPRLCVFPVRSDHPLPEQDLHPLLRPVLAEERCLVDEHFGDIGGIIQQHNIMQQNAIVRRPPVPPQMFKQKNGICWIKESMKPVETED